MTAEEKLKELWGLKVIVGDDDCPIAILTQEDIDLIANLVIERMKRDG